MAQRTSLMIQSISQYPTHVHTAKSLTPKNKLNDTKTSSIQAKKYNNLTHQCSDLNFFKKREMLSN